MLHVLNHPLGSHVLTHLRDQTTKPVLFRTLSYQISLLLALEATCDLATEEKSIETPMESMTGRVLARPLVIVPILRAGRFLSESVSRFNVFVFFFDFIFEAPFKLFLNILEEWSAFMREKKEQLQ